jgi:hypothetical protein
MLEKVNPCFVTLRGEKENVFNHAILRRKNVERKQAEVVSTSHCGTHGPSSHCSEASEHVDSADLVVEAVVFVLVGARTANIGVIILAIGGSTCERKQQSFE